MNRIEKAFENGKSFIGFLTAGDPNLEKTEEFILKMERAGADLIEIGIPFSDPVAEGDVIQEANIRALSVGTTVDKIFDMVKSVRTKTQIPLALMTYANPVFYYGYEKFFKKCEEVGIDGIIIPDMPYEEKDELAETASRYGVKTISLIAPTSEQRIRTIAENAEGFLYVVSSMGVSGVRKEINTDLKSILKVIKETTNIPCAIGFGISTPQQAKEIGQMADGIIVGSAIVKIIQEYKEEAGHQIYEYVRAMKDAIKK
ncbi:tryptophan synthase subunit alpha [Anaerosacchariphilus polymeriproducens]|uniref:Tryptophan synthase alpha chain n=1 Tax=Anaerosacchariphilus polymeriproducens TaxID=1812858 RepID=A0A371AVF7_9FIRM|nr:tryptophan synthase subunit alpha [Anaerosacchariphilus polymeriproducens]RDU23460.1 tryptophan synthase subunit alpha [Anaerosacchariphilus polymeriproducens]